MGSKYQRSVRGCLPPWALILQGALVVLFVFFASSDPSSSENQQSLLGTYQVLQDVMVMAALGLGFLTSSLRRHSWSSVAFNLFLLALGVQWALLMDGFLSQSFNWTVPIKLYRVHLAAMSAMSVLISMGAVLGKANLVQLAVMALVEVTAFGAFRMLTRSVFQKDDHATMMHIHVFAAYFGLTVAWFLSRPLPTSAQEKDQVAMSPSLFAMLGTLFLWIFWPSFNSALLSIPNERNRAILNTYYALAVSAVTATSVSAWIHPHGKISMTRIHNAVLAGGVAVGPSCHLIPYPSLAMVLGLVAGLVSISGAKCLPVCLHSVLRIHDTSGIHYTFGLPGLLGGITYVVLMAFEMSWASSAGVGYQVLIDTGALSLAMAVGLVSGLLTGFVLNLKIWRGPHVAKFFDDQAVWEFPHLAVGF
ncbi:blood group Rh(CE) polypeptide [Ochotona curzoniae]|uniref:blood group Rh(CE) polypeptide n=1 Tax=Ochotona curzoniae TaxID=130825 RepID=UPI001B34C72C|nr:blood group Rh(CE) polypeptide [Ochotona curzoniae]